MRLDIIPVPKPRMTQRDRWAKRPAVVRYYSFCDQLREQWGDNPVPEMVLLEFELPMPASWSAKKKAEMDGKPHQQRPDIDNLAKAFLDALCEDDSYVYHLCAGKFWSSTPGITVQPLTQV